jgi:hypothetical protein
MLGTMLPGVLHQLSLSAWSHPSIKRRSRLVRSPTRDSTLYGAFCARPQLSASLAKRPMWQANLIRLRRFGDQEANYRPDKVLELPRALSAVQCFKSGAIPT